MKKVLYFVLLAVELFVGVLLLSALWNSTIYIPIVVAAVLVVGLTVFQAVRYFKTSDPVVKKKALKNIALIMLIPSAVFFITFVGILVAFMIEFA